ncbi:MAG: T9SS type A sorting domain-containing protein, partial [Crocinitomicaceae bacterium]
YAYTESSSPNNPNKSAHLLSPCFDLSGQTGVVFNFWYHMYGATMGTLAVEVSTNNGATWNTVFDRNGDQGQAWLPASVNLSSYAGQTIQLRIVGKTENGFTSDMAVDDISVNVLKFQEQKSAGVDIFANESDILIFPNPANDYAIIDASSLDADEMSVTVLDMLGKEIYATNSSNNDGASQFRIPTNSFESGTYVIVLRTSTGATFNRKLVVRN